MDVSEIREPKIYFICIYRKRKTREERRSQILTRSRRPHLPVQLECKLSQIFQVRKIGQGLMVLESIAKKNQMATSMTKILTHSALRHYCKHNTFSKANTFSIHK